MWSGKGQQNMEKWQSEVQSGNHMEYIHQLHKGQVKGEPVSMMSAGEHSKLKKCLLFLSPPS